MLKLKLIFPVILTLNLFSVDAAIAANDSVKYAAFCKLLEKSEPTIVSAFLSSTTFDLNEPCDGSISYFGKAESKYPLEITLSPDTYGKWQKRLATADILIAKGAKFDLTKTDGQSIFLSTWSETRKDEYVGEFLNYALDKGISLKTKILPANEGTLRFERAHNPKDDDTGADALMLASSNASFDAQLKSCSPESYYSKSDACKSFMAMAATLVKNSDLAAQDAYGRTALHRAVDYKFEGTTKYLLEAGAAIDSRDFANVSVTDYAVSAGDAEVLALLKAPPPLKAEPTPDFSKGEVVENPVPAKSDAPAFPNADNLEPKAPETKVAEVKEEPAIKEPAPSKVTLQSAFSLQKSGKLKAAREEFSKLTKEGNAIASFELGRMYAKGEGGAKDFSQARKYFEAAAQANHPQALFALGLMHVRGDGVPKDKAKAKAYLTKAASLGSKDAKSLLGNM